MVDSLIRININVQVNLQDLIESVLSNYLDYEEHTRENFVKCIIDYLKDSDIEADSVNSEDINYIINTCKEYCNKILSFQ